MNTFGHLLPFVEQANVYEAQSFNSVIPSFLSPLDFTRTSDAGYCNFAANVRVFASLNGTLTADLPITDPLPPTYSMMDAQASIPRSFTDGTSNTILFATRRRVRDLHGGPRLWPGCPALQRSADCGGTTTLAVPTFNPGNGTVSARAGPDHIRRRWSEHLLRINNASVTTTTGTLYTAPVSVARPRPHAIAAETGFFTSAVSSASYTIDGNCAPPTFSLAAGSYTGTKR